MRVLSTHFGTLRLPGGDQVRVDDLIITMLSIVFNAVYVSGGAASIAAMKATGDAVYLVRDGTST